MTADQKKVEKEKEEQQEEEQEQEGGKWRTTNKKRKKQVVRCLSPGSAANFCLYIYTDIYSHSLRFPASFVREESFNTGATVATVGRTFSTIL